VPLEAVAVSVQLPATDGAVNTPALEIDPHEAVHATDWLAVNVCVFIACRFTAAGVIVIGEITVTAAESAFPPPVGVAVTVQEPGASGGVNSPAAEIVPHVADHVAGWVAVNSCVAASLTVAALGDTVNTFGNPIVSVAAAVYAGPLAAVA
jgi:hypothetical protein